MKKFENNFFDRDINENRQFNSIIKQSKHINNFEISNNILTQKSFNFKQTIDANFNDFLSTQLTNLSRLIIQIMNNKSNFKF